MRLTTFQLFLPNDVSAEIMDGNPAYKKRPKPFIFAARIFRNI